MMQRKTIVKEKGVHLDKIESIELRKGSKQEEETTITKLGLKTIRKKLNLNIPVAGGRGLKKLSSAKKLGENTWTLLSQEIYAVLEETAAKKHAPCSIQGGPMIPGTAYIAFKRGTAGSQGMPVRN